MLFMQKNLGHGSFQSTVTRAIGKGANTMPISCPTHNKNIYDDHVALLDSKFSQFAIKVVVLVVISFSNAQPIVSL